MTSITRCPQRKERTLSSRFKRVERKRACIPIDRQSSPVSSVYTDSVYVTNSPLVLNARHPNVRCPTSDAYSAHQLPLGAGTSSGVLRPRAGESTRGMGCGLAGGVVALDGWGCWSCTEARERASVGEGGRGSSQGCGEWHVCARVRRRAVPKSELDMLMVAYRKLGGEVME